MNELREYDTYVPSRDNDGAPYPAKLLAQERVLIVERKVRSL